MKKEGCLSDLRITNNIVDQMQINIGIETLTAGIVFTSQSFRTGPCLLSIVWKKKGKENRMTTSKIIPMQTFLRKVLFSQADPQSLFGSAIEILMRKKMR